MADDSMELIVAEMNYAAKYCGLGSVVNEMLDDFAKRLAALPEQEWRPISEMPKDGSYIVGRHLSARPVVLRWHDARWIDINAAERDPTHGIALPPPPTVDEREGEK